MGVIELCCRRKGCHYFTFTVNTGAIENVKISTPFTSAIRYEIHFVNGMFYLGWDNSYNEIKTSIGTYFQDENLVLGYNLVLRKRYEYVEDRNTKELYA